MQLRIGSKGDNVKKLQLKLGLIADGVFGRGTDVAVKKWQKANGLTADGIVGEKTWNKLFAEPIKEQVIKVKEDVNTSKLRIDKLKNVISADILKQIPEITEKFEINTPLRLAHFLAQCAHESCNFKFVVENLNYSAEGLKKIFSRYFPGNLAYKYAKQPEKIASRVYADRMGNGSELTKEGFKYRGRGYFQLTGKNNYRAFGDSIGVDVVKEPDLVATKYPLLSAAWFFYTNNLHLLSDNGSSDKDVTEVTKKVNGGVNGLSDRIKYFRTFYSLLK